VSNKCTPFKKKLENFNLRYFHCFSFKKGGILFLPVSRFPASLSKIGARKVAVSLNWIKKGRVGGKRSWG
jgi:hypothetical protein